MPTGSLTLAQIADLMDMVEVRQMRSSRPRKQHLADCYGAASVGPTKGSRTSLTWWPMKP